MRVLCSVSRSPSSRGTFGRAKVMRLLVRGACLYLAERAGTHAPLPFMSLSSMTAPAVATTKPLGGALLPLPTANHQGTIKIPNVISTEF